ncbi:MAG TPA: LacI family DNA-binding transcriptional regulator, partial [Candidatus Limnocylindrales bacterium]
SAATRERVLEAARALDYVPNALARGRLKGRVPVVAVIVHDITDPYFAEVVRGVEDAASAAGFLVITCSSERDAERERSYVRLLRSIRAAAVVFAGSGLDDPALTEEMDRHLAAMRADGAAVVHLSPHALGEPDVGVDNAAGIAAMVAALVALGHRRIAFLAGPRSLYVARERLAGYRLGLEAAGIDYDERLVARTSFDADGGAIGIETLLAADVPFTALSCANDSARARGTRAPGRDRYRCPGGGLGRGLRRHPDRGTHNTEPVDRAIAAARDGPARVRARRGHPRRP